MKLFRSVFKDHNGVNRLDIFIAKVFLTPASDTFVLAEQEIRGVAGASLPGEFVTDFLDLQIDNVFLVEKTCEFVDSCSSVCQSVSAPNERIYI